MQFGSARGDVNPCALALWLIWVSLGVLERTSVGQSVVERTSDGEKYFSRIRIPRKSYVAFLSKLTNCDPYTELIRDGEPPWRVAISIAM